MDGLPYILLSVAVSGLFISFVTLLSERLGTRLGGMVSNLPSTLLVSLLFVGITQGAAFASEATHSVPLGMTLSTLFLLTFLTLLPRGLWVAITGGLAAWGLLAWLSSYLSGGTTLMFTLIYFSVAIGSWFLAEKVLKIFSSGSRVRHYSWTQMLMRAMFAGSVVGFSVSIAQYGSAFWTGIFSTFPAVMLSSMVILTLTAGPAFARGLGKIMLLASTNIVIYGFLAGWLFPVAGIWLGTLIAFVVSAFWVFMLKPLFDRSS